MQKISSIIRNLPNKPCCGLIILDRDGILIRDTGYPHHFENAQINVELITLLSELRTLGYCFGFASNQGGIGLELYGWPEYLTLTARLDELMHRQQAKPDFWLACAVHPNAIVEEMRSNNHSWRKPESGMLLYAMDYYKIDTGNTVFIGDRESDMVAAKKAGITGIRYCGWPEDINENLKISSSFIAWDLYELRNLLLNGTS